VSNADRTAELVARAVADWFDRRGGELSEFYRSQFNGRRTLSDQTPAPDDPEVLVDDAFLDLSCRQASMTVGVLQELNKV